MVVRDLTADMIEAQVKACIDSNATVKTDGFKLYSKLKTMVAQHQVFTVPSKKASSVLPWVHIMISNAKRKFAGINHMIKGGYVQNYLYEFCYKVNRRYYQNKLFNRLLIACISDVWYD